MLLSGASQVDQTGFMVFFVTLTTINQSQACQRSAEELEFFTGFLPTRSNMAMGAIGDIIVWVIRSR